MGGVYCFYFWKRLPQKKLSVCSSGDGDASWHVIPPQLRRLQQSTFHAAGRPADSVCGSCAWTVPACARCAPVLPPQLALRVQEGSWAGAAARMEGDVMDKVEATATVCDFDPMSGSIPATKVEITVSCRWVHAALCARERSASTARFFLVTLRCKRRAD